MITSLADFPFLLFLLYNTIPVTAVIILIIIRTALEDRMLSSELADYDLYTVYTRFWLVPNMW